MSVRRHWLAFVAVFVAGVWLGSAVSGRQPRINTPGISAELGDQFYESYANGNTNQARQSLHDLIQLLQNNASPHGQALGLFLSYSRLYALEARAGDPDAADVSFVKARYWAVRDAEIGNRTESDIAKIMRAFTTNSCIDMVDDWDKRHLNGRRAKYLQDRSTQK